MIRFAKCLVPDCLCAAAAALVQYCLIFMFRLQLAACSGLGWLAVDAAEFEFSAGFAGAWFVAAYFWGGADAVVANGCWEIGFDLRNVAILVYGLQFLEVAVE